jgi:membrane protein DedA with SNARE-associated domain
MRLTKAFHLATLVVALSVSLTFTLSVLYGDNPFSPDRGLASLLVQAAVLAYCALAVALLLYALRSRSTRRV